MEDPTGAVIEDLTSPTGSEPTITEITQPTATANGTAVLEGHDGRRPTRFLVGAAAPADRVERPEQSPGRTEAAGQAWQGISIGRATDNDVEIASPLVSRHHAVLMRSADRFFLVDLGSSNGTQVDGVAIEPGQRAPLEFGSEIYLGQGATFTLTR